MDGLIGRRTVLALGVGISACASVSGAGATSPALVEAALPRTKAAVMAGGPLTIVCLGSSSTLGLGASGPQATYPARLHAELAERLSPLAGLRVHNAGRAGDEAAAMLARVDADVTPHRPHLVIWQVGSNAALRADPVEPFKAAIERGVARFATLDCDLMLMDPQNAPMIEHGSGTEPYRLAIIDTAHATGTVLIQRHRLMRGWARAGAGDLVSPDGLHMSDRGYALLAGAVADMIVAHVAA